MAGTSPAMTVEGLVRARWETRKPQTMNGKRFDRLVVSLEEVRTHIASGRFAGRITKVTVDVEPLDMKSAVKTSG
jgi:hypothetical protein